MKIVTSFCKKCTVKHFGQKMDKKYLKGTQQASIGYLDHY